MEVSMSALIAIAALLVVVANGLFALHIWSGFSDQAQSPVAGQ
jgi:hypothetical protein